MVVCAAVVGYFIGKDAGRRETRKEYDENDYFDDDFDMDIDEKFEEEVSETAAEEQKNTVEVESSDVGSEDSVDDTGSSSELTAPADDSSENDEKPKKRKPKRS